MKTGIRYLKGVTTLKLFEDRCTGCGMCEVVCPHGVFRVGNGRAVIVDRDACMECSACSRNCPEEALFVQSGVGCAQAVINSALGRSSSSCCNLDDYQDPGPVCGPLNIEDAEASAKKKSSGCC